jgi:N-methylhydantoinase B
LNKENYVILTALLSRLPVHWRYFIKTKLFEAIWEEVAKLGKPSFPLALRSVRSAYPQLASLLHVL